MDFLPAIVYYLNIMDNLFCAIRTLSQFITPAVALWDGLIPRRYAAAQPRLHLTVMPWALHYCLGVRCKKTPPLSPEDSLYGNRNGCFACKCIYTVGEGGVGLQNPYGSFPTCDCLWFYDSRHVCPLHRQELEAIIPESVYHQIHH